MATIPIWLTTAAGPFAVVITPQTVDAAGLLSNGTSVTLTGSIDSVRPRTSSELERIEPLNATRAHNVKVLVNNGITLGEILKKAGSNLLAAAAAAGDIHKVVFTRGAQAWTYYGILESYNEEIARGKSVGVMNLEMVDPGEANPAYA